MVSNDRLPVNNVAGVLTALKLASIFNVSITVCLPALPLSLSVNSHLNDPGKPASAGTRMSSFWILLELRKMEVMETAGSVRHEKLQSYCQHQQTNTQLLADPRYPFCH